MQKNLASGKLKIKKKLTEKSSTQTIKFENEANQISNLP